LIDRSSEKRSLWLVYLLADILGVISVRVWSVEALAFPVYSLLVSLTMFCLIKSGRSTRAQRRKLEKL
jgi:hypothetical protein